MLTYAVRNNWLMIREPSNINNIHVVNPLTHGEIWGILNIYWFNFNEINISEQYISIYILGVHLFVKGKTWRIFLA